MVDLFQGVGDTGPHLMWAVGNRKNVKELFFVVCFSHSCIFTSCSPPGSDEHQQEQYRVKSKIKGRFKLLEEKHKVDV